jgi:hypothetical protein
MIDELRSHLHYDEQLAVEFYVLRHYRHLLTDEERATLDAGLARWWERLLERMHEWGAHARMATVAPPWQPLPLDAGHAEEGRAIVARLRATHGDAMAIARCAHCTRVLRDPAVGMCPWCGLETRPPAPVAMT